jgi:hypothetical protein
MQITAGIIKAIFPKYKHPEDLAEVLTEQFEKYEINTVNRAAGFLAQCGHESAGFTILKENLNYSAEGLTKIFKKYFPTLASAQPYHRQPEKIANKVYGGRMGNGPEASGDGYKFCGRGAIQLTGRDNYTKFATDSQVLETIWMRDFPAGDALIINRGTTTLTSTLEATNGITIANTGGGFANEHVTITGITTATPAVVTAASHGLVDGDRVVITKVIGTMAQEINNNTYVVDVLTANTFALYDVFGVPITTVGAYSSSGQITKTGPELGVVDSPVLYYLTLGSAVCGNDNDKIYFVATKFNGYVNLGDIA